MPTEQRTVTAYTCNRCGYGPWIARNGKPQRCANKRCRSPYYDSPRKYKKGAK